MSSPQSPTSGQDNTNQTGAIISSAVTLLILPTVFVALRIVSRSRAKFWWDDLTLVVGMMLSWGPNIINILASRKSLGHHSKGLPDKAFMDLFLDFYAFELLYSLSIFLVKLSVILFQYRIFPVPSFRRVLRICAVFVIAFETASTIAFTFQCTPINAFWTSLAGTLHSEPDHRCIYVVGFLLANGSINTVTDFALLVLPLPMIWSLRATMLQRSILTGIFITGLMVTAVSMVRLVSISRYRNDGFDTKSSSWDPTYDIVPTMVWTAAEPSIAVVSACLPSLRPLFVRVVWGGAWRSDRTKSQYLVSSNKIASSWRGGTKVYDRNFSRLPENGMSIWANNVAVCGGGRLNGTEEEVLELSSPVEQTPTNRIRAKTTVTLTVSERVDWKDNLF